MYQLSHGPVAVGRLPLSMDSGANNSGEGVREPDAKRSLVQLGMMMGCYQVQGLGPGPALRDGGVNGN